MSSKPWTLGELGIPEPWCATEGETEGPRRCNVGGDQCNVGEERGRGGFRKCRSRDGELALQVELYMQLASSHFARFVLVKLR